MNVERMTQRVQEALNTAYSRALSERNTQTTPEHLLAAFSISPKGSQRRSWPRRGSMPRPSPAKVDQAIGRLPRFSGSNPDANQVTVSPALTRLLTAAEDEAEETQRRLRLRRAFAAGDDRRQRRRSGGSSAMPD